MSIISCLWLLKRLHFKRKWFVSSVAPQAHNGLSKIFLEYRCSHRELHFILSHAWWTCPRHLPAKKKLGGLVMLLLRWRLNTILLGELCTLSGNSFQSLITEGRIHIFNDKQCRSRSVGYFRSQLIWICTVEEANWSGSTLFAKTGHVIFSRRRVKP